MGILPLLSEFFPYTEALTTKKNMLSGELNIELDWFQFWSR